MRIKLSLPTEHDIQAGVFTVLKTFEGRYWELKTIHAIPNGGKLPYTRTKKKGRMISPERIKLVAEGLRSGIPDICVPYSDGFNSGLYIEMKRPGNDTSPEQESMIEFLKLLNHRVQVINNTKEAVELIYKFTLSRYHWMSKAQIDGHSLPSDGFEDFEKKANNLKRDLEPVINKL